MSKKNNTDWNHLQWINNFTKASKQGHGFHKLRREVFKHTLKLVAEEGYIIHGENVALGKCVPSETVFFDKPFKVSPPIAPRNTTISVINADCIEVAQLLNQLGKRPCILNMASRRNPGGGAFEGSGAQEENIFRRSNLFSSLFQFVDTKR